MARADIDTRMDVNATGLRNPAEVESLIARMDVIIGRACMGLSLYGPINGVQATTVFVM